MNPAFIYPAEKLAAARRMLMLPHPQGEAESIAQANLEVSIGLSNLKDEQLDENARDYVATLRRVMDSKGINDPSGRGTAIIRAEQLSLEERGEFANAVDELAGWLARHRDAA